LSPNNASSNPILALRVGGEKVLGDDVPFYEAAFLGGAKNLRGYYPNRYAGDAAAFANAELRVSMTRLRFIFPWEVGVLGLFDAGRVWVDEDGSFVSKSATVEIDEDKIHTAVGGGLWLGILKRRQTLSFAVASGEDDTLFYVKAGFHF
jgi:outer membrane protein assembly factor BamA